ncbi:MAG TPA: shikimate dehydrogenase [Firmicutes bacterium]|jgi:shikimate dehydrogenase|nr:shikimate dehydrogenase [Bacillota bacterium]
MPVTGKTRLTGIIGDPIEQTLSPAMHNAAFAHLGLDFVYIPFRVAREDIAAALAGIRALGFTGLNVTIPHKEAVLPLLDELAPEAEIIGAVNTIHHVGGRLYGYNTDGPGFISSLREEGGCEPAGKTVTIMGTGGAARAVALQLALDGAAHIIILGRRFEKAEALKASIKARVPGCRVTTGFIHEDRLAEMVKPSQVLVNATPVGMYPKAGERPLVERHILHRDLVVCDLVYNPVQTLFLQEARAAGCRTLPGLEMLVRQGALAFKIWTGREPPLEIMRKVVRKKLAV